jgi:hypothetical protein
LLDPRAVATWKVPTGMTSHVHAFDAREGGSYRISLTYDDPTRTGKTAAHTDTYEARLAAISRMTSPQLHAFILRYNWDDGLAIPRAVLAHVNCERGTALHVYYSLGGPFAEDQAKGDHRALLGEVKARLLSGSLPERDITYDPVTDWQINKLQLLKLRRAGVPDELIRPSRSR